MKPDPLHDYLTSWRRKPTGTWHHSFWERYSQGLPDRTAANAYMVGFMTAVLDELILELSDDDIGDIIQRRAERSDARRT